MPDNGEKQKERYLSAKPIKGYNFNEHMENYNVEATALHRKLQSKTDALRIVRKELEQFRTERDQFKLMAETLQLRYAALTKHNMYEASKVSSNTSVANILRETRERNMKLTTEVEMLKQRLHDLQGDIKVLREKGCRHNTQRPFNDCASHDNEEKHWKNEYSQLISHLENLKRKNAQLAFDMRTLCDEKQELITERDAYKCKAHRLNHELRNALKANEKHPKLLDIDSIVLENKFLHECLKNTENELELTKQTMAKYKIQLDNKKKKSFMRQDQMNNQVDFHTILSHKQIKSLLENGVELPLHTETVQDLKKLSLVLLDTLNDKNLALNHQRKANKMLAVKITELERKMFILLGEDSQFKVGFSPSETLLNMYCPASVDSDTTSSQLPQTLSSETCDTASAESTASALPTKHCNMNGLTNGDAHLEITSEADETGKSSRMESEDGVSTTNSESARSNTSSEYDGCETINRKVMLTAIPNTCDSPFCKHKDLQQKHFTLPKTIIKERIDSLRDLPPDLANLVEQALFELDMRDFEVENITVAKTLPTNHNEVCQKHNKGTTIEIGFDSYELEESTA